MKQEKESITELAEDCRKETDKYYQKRKNNPCYCYQLFHKAFQENSDVALNFLYSIYRPLVVHWIKKHPCRSQINVSNEDLFFDCMSHFVIALKQHSLERFSSLAHILSYLQKCVHSVIITVLRKNTVPSAGTEDDCTVPCEDHLDQSLIFKAAWNRIEQLLEDNKELLLTRLIYAQNLRPQQIQEEFPQIWQDTNKIRVDYQRIKRKLSKDNTLREILNGLKA